MKPNTFFSAFFAAFAIFPALLSAQIVISGYVRDASDQKPIQEAEVYFFDPTGRQLPARSTNSDGYFRFETTFKPGQFITIKAGKKGEYAQSETLTYLIKDPNFGTNVVNFFLRREEDTHGTMKVTGYVYDRKSKRPVPGATISVPDKINKRYSVKTNPSGLYDLNTFYQPGDLLEFRIEMTGYKIFTKEEILRSDGNNRFNFEISPVAKIPWCKIMLYGSGGAALASLGLYWGADKAYENYKDFSNADREDDYNKANNLNRASIVSAGVAVGLFAGWLICDKIEKNKNKAKKKNYKSSFVPQGGSDGAGALRIGMAYNF